jgi:hypothetical protein
VIRSRLIVLMGARCARHGSGRTVAPAGADDANAGRYDDPRDSGQLPRGRRVNWKLRATCLAVVAGAALAVAPIATAGSAPKFDAPKAYYLALGDSVAYGYQLPRFLAGLPPSGYDTGYVDVFAARLGLIRPGITAINYGCPGETSTSFIEGGCVWKAVGFALHDDFAGSQLDGALAFLRAHPGQVSPITITLWGGDVRELIQSCGGDFACIQSQAPAAIGKLSSNLALILDRLRATAPSAEIIVTGVWNSAVGAFPETDPLFLAADESIEAAARESRTRFAELFAVFNPQGDVAAETASICALTQLCSVGDSHPSDLGYSTIADLVFDTSGYSRLTGR